MKLFGQEIIVLQNQFMALTMNLRSWFLATLVPSLFKKKALPPPHETATTCVSIDGPGGLDRLQIVDLEDRCTVGCNLKEYGYFPPYLSITDKPYDEQFDSSMVMVKVTHFSVNYADVCIRWGLYESALRYVDQVIMIGVSFIEIFLCFCSPGILCNVEWCIRKALVFFYYILQ